MMQLIPRYMDQNCIRVVSGGPELSDAILEHEWQKIFYTGSQCLCDDIPTISLTATGTNVGRIIYQKAAKFLTPCTLELGGKSPCIVDSTADLPITAKRKRQQHQQQSPLYSIVFYRSRMGCIGQCWTDMC